LVFVEQLGPASQLFDGPDSLLVQFLSLVRPHSPDFAKLLNNHPLFALLHPLQFLKFTGLQQFLDFFDDLGAHSPQIL